MKTDIWLKSLVRRQNRVRPEIAKAAPAITASSALVGNAALGHRLRNFKYASLTD